ncbi:unnamed protein product [Rotaria socialis]|uniref:Uncharacterized protein n=1 Tax=Rotaria socialis TaxID=392032 RepID=A0A818FX31_9BILA|nr:unnamed protein product [Rotaria socialis]
MSTINENKSVIDKELSEDKQNLLRKLSTIFDHETAIDFVSPKTRDTKQSVTIDELEVVNYEPRDERLQRLRSLEHYQTTTQSLSRADLEASYQAFVRGQVGQQQYSRDELEQFVRNSADIDSAKRYFESAHDMPTNSLQSHLLFHSSKLNEQRANVLKSATSHRSLQQINDNYSLKKFFPEHYTTHYQYSSKQADMPDTKPTKTRPHSVHVEHKEKKYRIKFLKNSNELDCFNRPSHRSSKNRGSFLIHQKNIEALFDAENTTDNAQSSTSNTTNIHREIFPPLSLAALKEYRPTLTAKPTKTPPPKQQRYEKIDFIWEQSIVSRRHE